MDAGLTLTLGIFGSAGLFSLIQYLITRHDSKNRNFAQIKNQLNKIEHKCDRNELATTRLQLFFLIETQPNNEDAILTTAQRYFVELEGNAEAWTAFHRWAKLHKVDTSWYKALLSREKGNK